MSKKFENFTMEASVGKNSADVVLKVATEVVKRNRNIVNERTLTPTILHQMIRAVFDCVQFLMAEKNIEVRTKPEEYVNPVILDLVQMTSFELVSTLEQVSFALLRQQMPGDTYKEINSTDAKLSSWVKVDPPTDLYNLTSSLKNFPLTISQDMAESVETLTDELGVQVLVLKNLRPYYEIMKEEGVEISPKSPVYNLAYDPSDEDKFYFMGILPGKEHPILSTLNFTFTTYYTHCRTWLKWQWTSDGCWVGDKTSAPTLVCECSHLSLFAGTVQVPPHDLNTVIQFPLFLTSPYNIVPLIVLLIFLLLYLLLCLWGRHRDKKDKSKVDVIVLEDNYPGERFAYLLGVYTGSRINASSDAHVGVRLSGEDLDSRPHILKTSSRTTLRGNSDDWFLLYSNHHLGMLNYLQIWHDDSGSSPDWFVERIEVYDLEDKIEYLFELNVWIALEVDEYPEAMVAPARMDQFFSVKSVFLSNIVSGLRDTHYWTSILWRHPRNAVTRVERIQVVMCFIMVAMLVSLLLFCFSNRIYMPYLEDDPSFSIKGDDVLIFFTSFVAASLSACLVMVLFRKSYSHKYIRADKSLFLRSSRVSEKGIEDSNMSTAMSRMSFKHAGGSVISLVTTSSNSSKLSRFVELPRSNLSQNFIRYNMKTRLASERTTYQNFVLALHSIVRGTPLTPVTLPNSKSSLVLHKKYFCAAWCLCVVIIVLCAIPVSTIGWKLPPVKNEEWLFIFLGVLVFDAFIVSTFKILLFSAILGFMFQRMVPATTHNIRAKDGAQRHLKGDMDHLEKLADIRCQPWYCPLSDRMKVELRKKRVRKMRWRTVIDFLVVLLLLLVLTMLSLLFTADLYPTNHNTKHMLTSGHHTGKPIFEQVFNRTDFENFLETNFLSQLYRFMWYNLRPLVDLSDSGQSRRKDWTDDCVTRLLGNARIRQLRVMLGACPKIKYFPNMTKDCSPPWSSGHEDTDVYNVRWLLGGYKDVARKSTTWKYTDPQHSNSSRFYGRSATLYHGGGYIADLGYTKPHTRSVLSTLVNDMWLDHLTRAVFLELTLYNVNTRLFSQVVMVVEQTPQGQYLTRSKVESVATNTHFDLWNISFVVFLVFFLVRMCVLMNRRGIFVYFSQFLSVYEGFLLTLGFCTVILYLIHLQTSTFYVQQFQRSGYDTFFNFFSIIEYHFLAKGMMSVLFGCVVVRLLLSWRFGRTFITFYYTFLLSWSWIVWFTLFLILYTVVTWRLVGYFINVFIFPYYAIVIVFYLNHNVISGIHLTVLYKVVLYVMCMLSAFVMLIFIASFVYFYKIAKGYRLIDADTFNMATFLRDEMKNCCRRKKNM